MPTNFSEGSLLKRNASGVVVLSDNLQDGETVEDFSTEHRPTVVASTYVDENGHT